MDKKKVILFFGFACLLSWAIAAIIYLAEIRITWIKTVLLIIYMYMPALAVFLVQNIIYKKSLKSPFKISFKINIWFLWALLIPLLLSILATGVGFLFPGVSYDPEMSGLFATLGEKMSPEEYEEMLTAFENIPVHPIWLSLAQGLVAAITFNAVAAFGEELGWRGFLLYEFRKMSFFKAALFIGFLWGVWHAPLILMGHNFPQHPEWGVAFMTVFCMLYSVLFTFITLKANSVIAASIMHGSVNAFFGLTMMLSTQSSDLLIGLTGLAGFITLGFAIIAFVIYDFFIGREKLMAGNLVRFFPASTDLPKS